MLPGLAAALSSRKKFVEESEGAAVEAVATGAGGIAGELSRSSKFVGYSFLPKSDTGHVGLVNQGATCYLNSLLQVLYMTPGFRQSVFGASHPLHISFAACISSSPN
jgi:hypothetical protein